MFFPIKNSEWPKNWSWLKNWFPRLEVYDILLFSQLKFRILSIKIILQVMFLNTYMYIVIEIKSYDWEEWKKALKTEAI